MSIMDPKDSKKKEKGFLTGAFGKASRKFVLGSMLVLGLMGGVSGQAMAQGTAGANGITPYEQSVQPWSNDPTYQVKLQNIEAQVQLHLQRMAVNEQNKEAQLNKWHMQQITREVNANKHSKQKWDVFRIGNVGAQATAIETKYKAALVNDRAAYEANVLKVQQNLIRQINQLDAYYARLPQYRGATYNTGGYKPAVQQPTQVQAQKPVTPAKDQALTPQQQHDRLVRAYQDAQLKAAQQGRPLPTPSTFGLSPNDPALK
ncbi:MAG: hypothetical protein GC185_13345 [Alphaproteobacteria bacterium]|nr:hypothetical protein [Alphaproteobacteria bacterium]